VAADFEMKADLWSRRTWREEADLEDLKD